VIGKRTAGWWAVRLAATLALLLIVLPSYAYWEATWDPVVRRADVALADWPKGEKPVTVLLVSDTHVAGPDMPPERLARIVDQLNGLKPDLVLLAGDYISQKRFATRYYPPADAVAPFRRFKAPLGVVAVLGNHDYWAGEQAFETALQAEGITVLANSAVRRGPLVIGGLGDGFTGHAEPVATLRAMDVLSPAPGPRLLLTHMPDVTRRLGFKVDAILAGHTHCGQAVLPLYGSLARDEDRFRWLPCGQVDLAGTPLFVTAGLGTSGVPLRFRARPDVWLIRFGPAH
jgi:predicted MPP superfamily phosphohydrolase